MDFEAGKKNQRERMSEHRDAPAAMQSLYKGKEVKDVSLAGILPYTGAMTLSIHLKQRTTMNHCSSRKWFNRKVWC